MPSAASAYYGTVRLLEMSQEKDNEIAVGKVMLTKIGAELAAICGSTHVDDFLDYVTNVWKTKGRRSSTLFIRR
jgi:hypothetical protein